MSSDRDDPKEHTSSKALAPSGVGYGRPPVQHRFRKGQSGNPAGRPRRPKANAVSLDFGMRPTQELLKQEAYRPVTIREGDRTLTLPAIQAVFRAMNVSALKGNRLAQKMVAELVSQVEADDHRLYFEQFSQAIDYKQQWEREIERCRSSGLPDPDPIPHPDDIIIDARSGKVRFEGPMTREEKDEWAKRIKRRAEAQEEVSHSARQHSKARDPGRKEQWLRDWHIAQYIFDLINDSLPPRYKTKLKDRSYHPDASREGSALVQFRKMK